MPNRLLEADGTINVIADNYLSDTIDLLGETDTRDLDASIRNAPGIIVSFSSSADGRGYSLAAELREGNGFNAKLYASGKLNPDQLSVAFQCGFDAVIVSDAQWNHYGEASWMQAMDPLVDKTYLRTHWRRLDPIWERRAAPRGP